MSNRFDIVVVILLSGTPDQIIKKKLYNCPLKKSTLNESITTIFTERHNMQYTLHQNTNYIQYVQIKSMLLYEF